MYGLSDGMLSILFLLWFQWAGAAAQTAASLSATTASVDVPSYTSAAPTVPVKCPWTEHISPDKYKYYYNSVTGESKVTLILPVLWLYSWSMCL